MFYDMLAYWESSTQKQDVEMTGEYQVDEVSFLFQILFISRNTIIPQLLINARHLN